MEFPAVCLREGATLTANDLMTIEADEILASRVFSGGTGAGPAGEETTS
jgi:hypothetical protein